MAGIISGTLFFAVPIVLLIMFIVSIFRYTSAKKQNKKAPGTFSEEEMSKRKSSLVVLFIIVGVLALIVIGLTALAYLAVAFM